MWGPFRPEFRGRRPDSGVVVFSETVTPPEIATFLFLSHHVNKLHIMRYAGSLDVRTLILALDPSITSYYASVLLCVTNDDSP